MAAAEGWSDVKGERWNRGLADAEAMLAPLDAPLRDALDLRGPCRIAEIGCGGGGMALDLARQCPAGSEVCGYDVSPRLVETARRRARAEGTAVRFELADAAEADVPDRAFDRLVSRFGVMFFDSPEVAFARLARWLRPDGRFAFAVWGPMPENPWMVCMREVAAGFVDVPSKAPDASGPFRYADAEALVDLLSRAGFEGVESTTWRGALPVGGGLDGSGAASFALGTFSIGEAVARAGERIREDCEAALAARFREHEVDGVVRMDACVHLVTGRGAAPDPSPREGRS
ncbi:MAG: class I SAM-dependent methyltransferase [Planctomycetota bacterium]